MKTSFEAHWTIINSIRRHHLKPTLNKLIITHEDAKQSTEWKGVSFRCKCSKLYTAWQSFERKTDFSFLKTFVFEDGIRILKPFSWEWIWLQLRWASLSCLNINEYAVGIWRSLRSLRLGLDGKSDCNERKLYYS